ncbi:MAG: PH domain-containing protein [Candidatus Thermoplasmatota archaeon]|nr:PH domain-containing protein [Euryarchaeota archaeon]MBU4032668.1 PH domain-containing protein [Candidatus Thermoplasmatota archaeon]MBU4071082.1 PH domain-containing protein [Candidatus Thermoplasmatota archaeon]MBU4145179.1 PH domain-containing protein [Candidatus Thermoplasmatota archaeon]MBU4591130.1 PH domain-containing protein [Candidatus Thermoplasmatota archaeon]
MKTTQVRDLYGLRIEEGKVGNIPHTGDPLDGTWTKADPAQKKLMLIQSAGAVIFMILFMTPLMFIIIFTGDAFFGLLLLSPIIVAMVVTLALSGWSVNRMYERHRFRITDEELIIENGFITTNRVLIPLVRVQQVNVYETWLGKHYGLKNVMVNTAGFSYVPNAGVMGGNGMLMGLTNADEVAEAILSRVKKIKSGPKSN